MPQPLIGRDATSDLGVSLNTDAKSLNNAVKLLSLLRPGRDASATRSAIIALERFFSERLCRGDLRDPEPEDDAAAVKYAEWFAKHYKLFTKRLVALLAGAPRPDASGPTPARSSAADAKTQVLALAAVMECARSERPGRFNNELYHEALAAAVTGDAFTPELLGALASRYLVKMDVRYHTYRAVVKLAGDLEKTTTKTSAEPRAPRPADPSTSGRAAAEDIARNLYDVLSRTPPEFEDYAPRKTRKSAPEEAAGADAVAGGSGEEDPGEDFEAMLGLMKGGGGAGAGDDEGKGDEGKGDDAAWCASPAIGESIAEAEAEARRGSREKGRKRSRDLARDATVNARARASRLEASRTRDKWADGKRHRKLFQDAWLALLRAPFPSDVFRKALTRLHSGVIPHAPNPALLSDFCTKSIDRGGLDGMLALNAIFVLMTQHSLEYPKFYDRLYTLLEPSAFHAVGRGAFFQLLDVFLRTPALPASVAAAFVKRLARLAIRAPPAGAMTCVAFVHNMLRRHPGLGVLVHREEKKQPGGGGDDANGRARASPLFSEDPFDDLEPDPSASRALESSLWEMDALRSHYNPQVAKLTQVLERDLGDRAKTAEVPIGDLCAATYGSLAREELAARVKSAATTHRGREGLAGMFASPLMERCFPRKHWKWGDWEGKKGEAKGWEADGGEANARGGEREVTR